jgi:AhpD family alkylhydroperoxidase
LPRPVPSDGRNRSHGKEITMDARFNYYGNPVGQKFQKHLNSAARATESTLPAETAFLCMIRASQINGCSVCTDMHTKDAVHAGETSTRLNLVAAWREATVFTDAERAVINAYHRLNVLVRQPAGGYQPGQWS